MPLLPCLAGAGGPRAVVSSAVITLLTLFGVGLGLSLFTGRGALRSGLRMVLIGGGAGGVSFLVGGCSGSSPADPRRRGLETAACGPTLAGVTAYR